MPLRDLVRSLRINSRDNPPFSVELERELEDLRNVLLNLLMTLLSLVTSQVCRGGVHNSLSSVHTISASSALGVMTLALLVYIINLHIVTNTSFLRGSPTLTRILHAVPLLGIFCMAVFRLAIVVQSPAIAIVILLVCALPPFIIAIHLARRYANMVLMPPPVQMRDMVPVVSVPAAGVTVVSS